MLGPDGMSNFSKLKDRVREFLHALPFQPFVICMADGLQIRVERADSVLASPKKHTWVMIEDSNNDKKHYLAPALITAVEKDSAADSAI